MRNILIALSLLFVVHGAQAGYVRVLLPLYIAQPVAGAYGSLWQSELVMHNASATLSYGVETCAPNEGCPIDLTEDEELLPGETQIGLPARHPLPANPVAGATLWFLPEGVQTDPADAVRFDLRVTDLSRGATAAGTEIPVVRESQFRTTAIHLLNIPADTRFRVSLRMFEMNLAQADFTVRVFDQSTDALLAEQHVTTSTGGAEPGGFTPAFVEINNLENGMQATRMRIEIDPVSPGVAFWAYVSITNNDSQQITLVTPQ